MTPATANRQPENVKEREAVRAVLLTPEGRVLLMQFVDPENSETFWLTPGGGIDPGETPEEALRREVEEETGLADPALEIAAELWRRTHTFEFMGKWFRQFERFFLVHVAPFEPELHVASDEYEQTTLLQYRWWRPQEIAQSNDVFAPRKLAALLDDVVAGRMPASPIEIGV